MNRGVIFPGDENGQVLQRMAEESDDLSKPREIDFAVIFPTEDIALKFAVRLLKTGQKVSFSEYEDRDELPWQVLVHPFMVPTQENISGYEGLLENEAAPLGGQNDGWGCFQQN